VEIGLTVRAESSSNSIFGKNENIELIGIKLFMLARLDKQHFLILINFKTKILQDIHA
jgi:hypothetical protein